MDVYYGRFLTNGGCGYVLKPSYLRDDNAVVSSNRIFYQSLFIDYISNTSYQSMVYQHDSLIWFCFAKVISALHLPRPEQAELKANSVDPYVVLQIFGVPRDCDEVRTKTIYHNCTTIFSDKYVFHNG